MSQTETIPAAQTPMRPDGAANEIDVARLTAIGEEILAGTTDLAAVNGITADELEAVYSLGHSLYATARYKDAQDLFRFLTLHRHMEARFWFGLAASCHMLGDITNAARSYAVCALLNPMDAQVSLRAGECFLAMGDRKTAATALEAAVQAGGMSAGGAAHAARAGLLLGQLTAESGA